MDQAPADEGDGPAPWLFFILYLIYGLPSAYVTVTMAFVLAKAGVTTAAIGALAALSLAPTVWKVLWAAPIDMVWTYRGWLIMGALVSAVLVAATGFAPMTAAGVPLLTILAVAASATSTVVSMGAGGLLAHTVPDRRKGRAAGWEQAGNLGGGAIGGGAGLWIASHAPGGMATASVVLGLVMAACALAVLAIPEPSHDHRSPRAVETLRRIGADLWELISSRMGLLAALVLILPISTGAASNLFAAIATEWRGDANLVALVTGVAGGAASAVGCLFAGFACDRFDRKTAYIAFAVSMAACAAAMAVGPRSPLAFTVFTLIYAVTNGFMYAAFAAVIYEAVGRGAAATKSQLLGSIGNVPLAFMTWGEGVVQTRFGSAAMLWTEVLTTLASIALFGLIALGLTRLRVGRGAAAVAPAG